jgi:hypothetical protein
VSGQLVVEMRDHVAVELVLQVGHHQADPGGVAERERAADRVGGVPEGGSGSADPLLGLLRHLVAVT